MKYTIVQREVDLYRIYEGKQVIGYIHYTDAWYLKILGQDTLRFDTFEEIKDRLDEPQH